MISFEYSADYGLIREILTEPRCWRRMQGATAPEQGSFLVRALPGFEYVIARDETGAAIAVFVLIDGAEVHFCFVPSAWGRTEPIARAFVQWAWANTGATRLLGPVPRHNRLALRLARAVGFQEIGAIATTLLLEIRKP